MIVGGDKYSQSEVQALQKIARELNIQDRVSFHGPVAQERLPIFYNAADVCVIPSYYESFGMVALESLACGTPVVASDVGAMRQVVHHSEAGYILKDNSPYHLASKISDALTQRDKQPQHVETRRTAVAAFSWTNVADMILREYYKVLEEYPNKLSL